MAWRAFTQAKIMKTFLEVFTGKVSKKCFEKATFASVATLYKIQWFFFSVNISLILTDFILGINKLNGGICHCS